MSELFVAGSIGFGLAMLFIITITLSNMHGVFKDILIELKQLNITQQQRK